MNIQGVVDFLNSIIWSNWLVILCLGSGIFFSILLKFPQIRLIKDMVGQLIGGKSSETGVSSFQGFAMALGGRVGTGNIAGVATAIGLGGPGAVFWMWIIAFLGAGSAYIEAALAQVWKEDDNGQYRGGPSYYIEKGLGMKWYAVFFAISAIVACGLFLPGVQANSIASAVENAFGLSPYVTGGIIVFFLAFVVFGGVKRIGKAAEVIVPFMAIAYIIVALIILVINANQIIPVLKLIVTSAFDLKAGFGALLEQLYKWVLKEESIQMKLGKELDQWLQLLLKFHILLNKV